MSGPDQTNPSFEGPDPELDPVGRIEWLREQLAFHDAAYYERDAPVANLKDDAAALQKRLLGCQLRQQGRLGCLEVVAGDG